jgi:hypothetical protein
MKYLTIIATRDFLEFWKIAESDFLELVSESLDEKILIWQKDDELSFPDYSDLIIKQINLSENFELGVIFHKLNGDAEAASFQECLNVALNDKLAFCEWYSSNRRDFWNEQDATAGSPYNNLLRAWKGNTGNKSDSFEEVWDYFRKSSTTNLNNEIQKWLLRLNTIEYQKAKLITSEATMELLSERDRILKTLHNS